jgi:uncharacterized protein YbbC (DUF1343 family)
MPSCHDWPIWKAALVAVSGLTLAIHGLYDSTFSFSFAGEPNVPAQIPPEQNHLMPATPTEKVDSKRIRVSTGIDALVVDDFTQIRGLRVGLLTNHTGRDVVGRRSIDLFANSARVRLAVIFSPEHGLTGEEESAVESGQDQKTGLPVYSLYGASPRPAKDTLSGVDGLVIDLQDVGARFYTYATTMAYAMEEAARRALKVVVLDRPNPIGPAGVRGPVLDSSLRSFIGYFPMPVEHGMTLGELARMFNAENRVHADLTVIKMRGYRRALWYDETGLPWVFPSPNLRSFGQTILYPAIGLIESTNVSVGRGTGSPFELVGAPWIDGAILTSYLRSRRISGVRFEPSEFTPAKDRYAGEPCYGIRIVIDDRDSLDAPRLGIELAAALRRLYPGRFRLEPMLNHLGSRDTLAAIETGEDPSVIVASWQPALRAFKEIRKRYLLYR